MGFTATCPVLLRGSLRFYGISRVVVEVKRALRLPASHGKAVCQGGAIEHREGGCLVRQPMESSSVKDQGTEDSQRQEIDHASDRYVKHKTWECL